jgi:hypothetical protein
MRLQLHLVSGGAKDGKSKALRTAVGAAQGKIKRCLQLLRRLLPLSAEHDIREWPIPDFADVTCPDDLPTRVGSIVVVNGSLATRRLVETYNAYSAAYSQLQHLTEEMRGLLPNLDAVIAQQSSMLAALAVSDLRSGSGASGLWEGPTDAMFNFANLASAPSIECRSELAAGMAYHVARGLQIWKEQRAQAEIALAAIAMLPRKEGTAFVELATDDLGRSHAMRYARKLLAGQIPAHTWSTVSSTGVFPPQRARRQIRFVARRYLASVAPVVGSSAGGQDADDSEFVTPEKNQESPEDDAVEDEDESLLDGDGEDRGGIWDDDDVVAAESAQLE